MLEPRVTFEGIFFRKRDRGNMLKTTLKKAML